MPNSLTHKYTSSEILRRLPKEISSVINKYRSAYDIGSLGPDTIMGLMLSKDEDKKLAGDRLHTRHIFEGIFNTAEYLRQNRTESEDELLAYFYGFLTHYATDCTVHPLVYAYISYRMAQKFDPILNGCLHTIVETEMDTYIGNNCLHGKNANSYWCFNWGRRTVNILEKFFLKVNKDTYKVPLNRKDIKESLFWYKTMMFICQRHRNGLIRYNIIEKIDKFLKADHLLMSALRPRALDTRYDYLNFNKAPYHAIYGDFSSPMINLNFPELLNASIEFGTTLVKLAYNHIMGGEKLTLELFKKSFNSDANAEYLRAYGLPVPEVPPSEITSILPEILAEASKLYGTKEELEAANIMPHEKSELDDLDDGIDDEGDVKYARWAKMKAEKEAQQNEEETHNECAASTEEASLESGALEDAPQETKSNENKEEK